MALNITSLRLLNMGKKYKYTVFTLCKPSKKGLHTMYLLNNFSGILQLGKAVTRKLLKPESSGFCSMRCALGEGGGGSKREFREICVLGNSSQDRKRNLSVT